MPDSDSHPLVAVTGPHTRLRWGWWASRLMLQLCGLRSVYVTANNPLPDLAIHGIVIGGGSDIEPDHYEGIRHPTQRYDAERDLFEIAMINRALDENIPVLGICRGAQLPSNHASDGAICCCPGNTTGTNHETRHGATCGRPIPGLWALLGF